MREVLLGAPGSSKDLNNLFAENDFIPRMHNGIEDIGCCLGTLAVLGVRPTKANLCQQREEVKHQTVDKQPCDINGVVYIIVANCFLNKV